MPSVPNRDTLAAVVAVLRKVGKAPNGIGPLDPPRAVTLLQQAVLQQISVVIGYTDAAGVSTQRVVTPINVRGGQLVAFDPASGRVRDFAIHRVTSVVPEKDG
jgi:predicted DNA-binding transcriptional regulator YafY